MVKQPSKLSTFIKSKWNRISKKPEKILDPSPEDFIKYYSKINTNNLTDISSLDVRRKIFISLLGLFQTWKQIPLITLVPSVFILPLKSDWIYNPAKYTEEIQSSILSQINMFRDVPETTQFIEMLKYKNSQGLVFWMLDEYVPINNNNNCDLIHPFWCHLNEKISNLYDPIMGTKYNNINFNMKWWQNKNKYISKYNVKTATILSEFYFLTMKFNCIKEILYQSNPKSFDVIKSYQNNGCTQTDGFKLYVLDTKNELMLPLESDLDTNVANDANDGDHWWISDDYDPYELD